MMNNTFIPNAKSGAFLSFSTERTMLHTSGRTQFWIASINNAISKPVLGTGPATFGCVNSRLLAHPHSFPFRILGEWGFLAGFLLLILAISFALKYLKNLKYHESTELSDRPIKAILAISLVAGVLHACLSGVMTMPAGQTAMILVGGWALSLTSSRRIHPQKPKSSNSIIALGLLLSVALFFFGARTISELLNRTDSMTRQGLMTPRFWQEHQACPNPDK